MGSLFGALHALLGSPLRTNLLAEVRPRWRTHAEQALSAPPVWSRVSRGLRALFVIGAALLSFVLLITEDGQVRWAHLGGLVIFGFFVLEVVPSRVTRGHWLGWALVSLSPVRVISSVGAWMTHLVRPGSEDAQPAPRPQVDRRADQLLNLAHAHEGEQRLGGTELKMIERLLSLPETDASEVMTPRTAITAVSAETTVADAIELAGTEGHTRIPVYDGDLDHVLGIFHIKDVLGLVGEDATAAQAAVRHHLRPALNVPETVRLPALLEQMQSECVHLAMVLDEYGGTAGVVTIEDLIEEIVGEIEDEHDSMEDQPQMEELDDGTILADGAFTIFDFNEAVGASLPEDESYETLGGLLFDRLGHIPQPGERLELPEALLEVIEADDRRVQRVRIEPRQPDLPQPESDAA